MQITDLIIIACSIFLLWRGASRGFVRSCLGPICLIIATAVSIFFYNSSKNIVLALLIGLFGPMALHFFISNYLKLWHTMTNPEWKPNPLSCSMGAMLTLIWGWVFIVLTLILLTIIPPLHPSISSMKEDVQASFSYKLVKPLIDSKLAPKSTNNKKSQAPVSENDIAALAKDPRFQAVLKDPDVQKAIADNNIAAMFSNPKIMALTQELMSDPDMLKKLMAFQQSQMQSQTIK